jgi:signal transduction histidine kinase
MTQQDMIADTPPVTASVAHAAGATVVPSSPASRSAPIGSEASARHAAVWLAWALWTLTVLLLIGYIALRLHWYVVATTPETTLLPYAVGPSPDAIPQVIANILAVATGLGFPTLGALIVSRASERRIGWLYCAIGLAFAVDGFSGEYAVSALLVAPGSLPAGLVFAWIQNWSWIVAVGLLFVFLPLLYPTGRLVSRRWKPVAVFAIALVVGGVVLEAVAPGPLANHLLDFPVAIANPLGIAALGPAVGVIAPIAALLLLLLILVAATSLLLRLRQSRGDERQQLKWFAYAVALLVVVFVTFNLFSSYLPREGVTLTVKAAYYLVAPFIFVCLPLLTGLAILKYRLYDIDRLINRTLVYSALTACVVGLYVLLVGGLGVLLQVQGTLPLSVLAIGLVALLVQPLRERLQRAVNRLLYGERDDPYALLTRLGSRLDATLAPSAILPTIVQTVRDALHLPYVAIARQQGEAFEVTAAAGEPGDDTFRLPLTYQGQTVGQFLLGARAPGEAFGPTDWRLLDGLARQIGIAIHAAQLTADLQRARARLVMAGEEERRRLRRDLHDGLGPALAAQSLKLEAARDLVLTSPEQAIALLSALLDESQRAITDIRRLVYALRPPELDELGLIGALRAQIARAAPSRLTITLDAPDSLPSLPAAVEVAAYRIAQEGLTNVVRHAEASTCLIRLVVAGAGGLCLEIVDDGRGLPPARSPGVGLLSMRERAEELGGDCVIGPAPGGGTQVSARLPCDFDGWGQLREEGSRDRNGHQSPAHRR